MKNGEGLEGLAKMFNGLNKFNRLKLFVLCLFNFTLYPLLNLKIFYLPCCGLAVGTGVLEGHVNGLAGKVRKTDG